MSPSKTWGTFILCLGAVVPFATLSGQEPPRRTILEITGRVVDEDTGEPLAGVRISIPPFTYSPGTSDTSGSYRLRDYVQIMNRPGMVEAILPGYFPEQRYDMLGCHEVIVPKEGDPVCQIQLDVWMRKINLEPSVLPFCQVAGTLFSTPSGEPADGIVEIDGVGIGGGSDSAGRYELNEVPAGLHTVRASTLGNSERRQVWVSCASADEEVRLNFHLAAYPIV